MHYRLLLINCVVGMCILGSAAMASAADGHRQLKGNADVQTGGLPAVKEGKFPVHIPSYDGIDQLLLLNNRWVIVGVSLVDEVAAKMNEWSGGELEKAAKQYEKAPHWQPAKKMKDIQAKYMTDARIAAGELKLDDASYYTITSSDDAAYSDGKQPAEVTQVLRSLGGSRVEGAGEIHWGNYCFLQMPEPMQQGKHYTITLGDGKKVTFLYDEMRTVSRAIKVNQVGYLPNAEAKYAYLGASLYDLGPLDLSDAKTFKVIDASSGEAVLEGEVELLAKNPKFAPRPGKGDDPETRPVMYGEDVYRIDLTPLKATGEFFITVPGVGRSWTFHHGPDTYGEAFYVAIRGLYHQRCGIVLGQPYTAWPREKASGHGHDTIYEADYIRFPRGPGGPKGFQIFDAVGGTTDMSRKTENVIGGWHDAADWDRNGAHYSCVFDMLYAYELAPKKFTDGQLNIPESGNGIPDILDEVDFGLAVWTKSMNADGGVSGFIETWTHPGLNWDEGVYAFSMRTRWDSLQYAAAAAQLSALLKPFNEAKAAEYLALAKKAYAFGTDPANSLGKRTFDAKKNRGRGEPYTYEWEEKDEYSYPSLIHAKLQLYKATGDKQYLNDIAELYPKSKKPWEWRFTLCDASAWYYFEIARYASDVLPADLVASVRNLYVEKADAFIEDQKTVPYGYTLPAFQNYWLAWGGSVMTNHNRPLLCAYVLTGEEKYRTAAIRNEDFMLGANPLGMAWTTGLGYAYPVDIQHAVSSHDGIMDPVPGILIYGATGGPPYHQFRERMWEGETAEGKKVSFIKEANKWPPLWRSFMQHDMLNVSQCEFTVHETMASNIFSAAMLMDEGWQPSEQLKNRKPREETYLFGYWQLP